MATITDDWLPDRNSPANLLWQRLNAKREAEGLSWRAVAHQTGCNPSTLTRMGQGHAPGLDNANKLFAWLRDERTAACLHDWRFAYAYPRALDGMQETYYCTKCLERRVLP